MTIAVNLMPYTCAGSLDRMWHKSFLPSSYSGIYSTKSPGSGAGNGSEPKMTSQVGRVGEILCSVDQSFCVQSG
jgi:hypothetical protein